MRPIVGLIALAAVGGGLFWAVKSKAEEGSGPTEGNTVNEVTADSGITYLVETAGTREQDGQTIIIFIVRNEAGEPILTYQQFAGDNASRIWDKAAGGMSPSSPEWTLAVQDFSVFTSV